MRRFTFLPVLALIATVAFCADRDRLLHARDFADDPNLAAQPRQSVLVDSNLPAAGPNEPVVRYQLDSGRHSFCLTGRDHYFTGLVLSDERGATLFTMHRSEHCRAVDLAKGVYSLLVSHSSAVPNPNLLTFVGVDEPSAPLHDANGNPLGGYWAITSLNSGVLRPLPPPRNLGGIYTDDMPLIIDSSRYWDETSLFSFPPTGPPRPLGPAGFFLDMTALAPVSFAIVSGNHDCSSQPALCNFFGQIPNSNHLALTINDLGNSQFTFSYGVPGDVQYFASRSTSLSPNTMQAISNQASQATKMWLKFRYYPDSSQIGALNQGEAAFFEKCNYQGKGAVATNDFSPFSYSIVGITNNQFFSVRLSNNTTVQLSTGVPGGDPSQSYFIVNDTACLPVQLYDANLIYPLDKILLNGQGNESLSCPNCRLAKTNLSGFNVQGSNWQQADMTGATLSGVGFSAGTNLTGAKFINATLTNVNFEGSTLTGADFTGSKLTCVDFSGTAQNARDLRTLVTAQVQWIPSSTCRSNLSYTVLSTAILPPALWKTANLTGATFVDLKPGMQLSTQGSPLDLTGAILAGVNFEQASLDFAIMPGADFTGASLGHCSLRSTNLNQAKLRGTVLNNANLDGANMSGAFLDASAAGRAASLVGAFLRNVNLSGAQLSGADFTNASFFGATAPGVSSCAINAGFTQGCASAAGATLNNTEFSGAFLFGVDFSNATIQGVHFGNAIVIGANFANASLTGDTQVGTDSGFPGAFLQGANLQPARKLSNISLLNAYLDFSSQGNAFVTELSGNHTIFPGHPNPGRPVCVQMIYNNGSTVPTNNGTLTCPNGSQPSSGCGATVASNTAWESQVDISAVGSYQFPATYTPAAPNQFCQPDSTWFTGGLSSVRK